MGNLELFGRPFSRFFQSLFVSVWCGLLSVSVDFDHVICAVLRGEDIIATRGCRLAHFLLFPISSFLLCLAIALGIGLLFNAIYDAIG